MVLRIEIANLLRMHAAAGSENFLIWMENLKRSRLFPYSQCIYRPWNVSMLIINMLHNATTEQSEEDDNKTTVNWAQLSICWYWHVARIISSQKIYCLYGLKHHIVEMRGGVTDAGQQTNNERTNSEDRATQPMEAGGWVSQLDTFPPDGRL